QTPTSSATSQPTSPSPPAGPKAARRSRRLCSRCMARVLVGVWSFGIVPGFEMEGLIDRLRIETWGFLSEKRNSYYSLTSVSYMQMHLVLCWNPRSFSPGFLITAIIVTVVTSTIAPVGSGGGVVVLGMGSTGSKENCGGGRSRSEGEGAWGCSCGSSWFAFDNVDAEAEAAALMMSAAYANHCQLFLCSAFV
ncbi:1656_t:CDS:2, partial [Scutellospora calospora]